MAQQVNIDELMRNLRQEDIDDLLRSRLLPVPPVNGPTLTFIVHINLGFDFKQWPGLVTSNRYEIIIDIEMGATIDDLKERIFNAARFWNYGSRSFDPPLGLPYPERQLIKCVGIFDEDLLRLRREEVEHAALRAQLVARERYGDRAYIHPILVIPDETGMSPIDHRALPENGTIVEAGLMDGAVLSITDYEDMGSACREGKFEIVVDRLQRGASADTIWDPKMTLASRYHHDRYFGRHRTPVICCATAYGHDNIVDELLKAGANVNSRDHWDNTPLWWAAQEGHANIVRRLLEEDDIELDARGTAGDGSALMIAAHLCRATIVDLLMKSGADASATNQFKETALMLAVDVEEMPVERTRRLIPGNVFATVSAILQRLDETRGDVDAVDHENKTALWKAVAVYVNLPYRDFLPRSMSLAEAKAAAADIVKLLIDAGADAHHSVSHNMTPFSYAFDNGYLQLAAILRRDHFWPYPNLSGYWEIMTVDDDAVDKKQFKVDSFKLEIDETKGLPWSQYKGTECKCHIPASNEKDEQFQTQDFIMKNCIVTEPTGELYKDDEQWYIGECLFSYEQHFEGGPRAGKIVKWEMKWSERTHYNGGFYPLKMEGVFDKTFYEAHSDAWKENWDWWDQGVLRRPHEGERYYAIRSERQGGETWQQPSPSIGSEPEPEPDHDGEESPPLFFES
jgi:ankyrin repeat protein